jgi:uncharacterized protein YhfF
VEERPPGALTPAAAAFWQAYLAGLPPEHPHRHAAVSAFAFGDSPALAEQLAALVEAGRKRATAALPIQFEAEGSPLPEPGDPSIVTLWDGTPVVIIQTTDVRLVPFGDVDADFAAAEGEGDRTLAWWRAAHQAYFGRVLARLGGRLDDTSVVVCERFEVIWRR